MIPAFSGADPAMLVPTLVVIALLLAVSAFFSGAETALTVVSRGRMHQLEKDGSRAAANVNRLVSNRERMIGAVLLGNTFINILTSSLATGCWRIISARMRWRSPRRG
jgi:Mg2+/Co2+ transporter CorB